MKDAMTHPQAKSGSGLYRTVFQVIVLSDRPVSDLDLEDLAYEIGEGGSSGRVEVTAQKEISRREMALALQEQNSDPGFLLGDDIGWAYVLQSGDEVTWNDHDKDGCSIKGIIGSIEYVNDDVLRIIWKDGGTVEARIAELS